MSKLLEKLSVIQAELKAPKGQKNNFGKYNYRSCEDIFQAVKPLLHSLVLTVSDEMVLVGDRIYVKATVTIQDGTDSLINTAYAREAFSKKGMDDSQITGTASSYARKYALNGLFLIDDTKDADTMDNSDESKDFAMILLDQFNQGDESGLYTTWQNCEDNDLKEQAWKHLDSKTRSGIKKIISNQRNM